MEEIKNENQLDNKKLIVRVALLIIMLLLVITGTSLAIYTWRYNGTVENQISTVDVSIDYLESNSEIINITNALPMTDEEGKYQNETFDFAVTSKTTRNTKIKYTLNIEKLSLDTGYTALADNQVKVYLEDYNGNQLVAPTLISNLTNYQLYTNNHTHNTSTESIQDKFKLRVWIDESLSTSAKSWTSSTKLQYKFKINVATEEQQSTYPSVVYETQSSFVSIGDPLETVTATKWVIENNGTILVQENTQALCQQKQELWSGSSSISNGTCTEKEVQVGIGTYTEDYTTLNSNGFYKHNLNTSNGTVESNEICFVKDTTLHCLKTGPEYYNDNKTALLEIYDSSTCNVKSTAFHCNMVGMMVDGFLFDLNNWLFADPDGQTIGVDSAKDERMLARYSEFY